MARASIIYRACRRWRSNPSGKCSLERLARGTVTSTMRRAAHPSGFARGGAGAGCSAIKYQSLTRHFSGRFSHKRNAIGRSRLPTEREREFFVDNLLV